MKAQGLNRSILAIALPAIVSNITTPLLGLVDIAITGHVGGPESIAAIGVGASLFSMTYILFGFLRMGTAGLTAQCHGAGDFAGASAALVRSLITAAICGVAILVAGAAVGHCALGFLDADNASHSIAERYFDIVVWGAPAVTGMYVLNGWLLGMQDTRLPMWVSLSINVINIALSFTLAVGLGLGTDGIAFGTLCSQWIGFAICIVALWRRYRPQRPDRRTLFHKGTLLQLWKINADIFLRNVCLVAVTGMFTRAGALQSDMVLAANTLLMQFFYFFSYFSDGFAFAGEALAGKMYGAGRSDMVGTVVARVLRWGVGVASVFTAVYLLGGGLILRMLTDDEAVVLTAREYMWWAVSVPMCGFMAFIYDGVFVGLTRSRAMLWSVASGAATFAIVWFATRSSLANHGVWLAFVSYLAIRGLTLAVIFRRR